MTKPDPVRTSGQASVMLLVGVALGSAGLAVGLTLAALGRVPVGLGIAAGGLVAGAGLALAGRSKGAASAPALKPQDQVYRGASEAVTARPELAFSPEARTPRPEPAPAAAGAPSYGFAPPGYAPPGAAGVGAPYGPAPSGRLLSPEPVAGAETVASNFVPDYSAKAVPGLGRVYARLQKGEIRGHLLIIGGPDRGTEVDLLDDPITIGRADSNSVALKDQGVSSFQATIVFQQGAAFITDNRSKNGTYVNNEAITSQKLDSCDVVAFGQTKILVTLAE